MLFKIGDIVYYCDKDSKEIKRGIIIDIYSDGYVQTESAMVRLNDVYTSKEECKVANSIRTSNSREYLSMINSVEDLIKFLYTHNVCDKMGYIDYEARSVAQIKAKELLGLDL